MPLLSFIGNLGYVAVCLFGGYLAVKGQITIGKLQRASCSIFANSINPLLKLAQIANVMQSTIAACRTCL
jgi:ATP-binding cassette subfamily B protein